MDRRQFGLAALGLAGVAWGGAAWSQVVKGPERWEPQIRAFEEADRKSPPPAGAVEFVGSSSIVKWTTLAEDFPQWTTLKRGFGGSELGDTLYFADRIILPYHPKTVVVYAGDNDLANKKTPEQVFGAYKELVIKIRQALPETKVAFISIKPSIARWKLIDSIRKTNDMVREYAARDSHLLFIDICPAMMGADGMPRPELFVKDGLHMSPAGYVIWKQAVTAALR
jgi:hypothetical protein